MVTDRKFFENKKQIEELEDEVKKLKRRIEFLENQLADKDREISNMFGRSY
jgi:hypothetical protein